MNQKYAEDLLNNLELLYLRGFHDCNSILLSYGQDILTRVTEKERFSILLCVLEEVYSVASGGHDEKVKKTLGFSVFVESTIEKAEKVGVGHE